VFPFKASSIKNPSFKIMLVEEDDKTIDDSRWVPFGVMKTNLVSPRHQGRGGVAFGDGHIEAVRPEFGRATINSNPTL
jgi:prepilin-type processing-associated H-X9-DG protein